MKLRHPHIARTAAILAIGMLSACATGGAHHGGAPDGHVSPRTSLDEYVHAPDPSYTWSLYKQERREGYTISVLEMTSQKWLTEAEVDRTLWQHHLMVIVPDEVKSDVALLMIGGGDIDNKPDDAFGKEGEMYAQIAVTTKAVVAELDQVPNQPLTFTGDVPRWEDELIAYGWDQFLRGGRDEWLARYPMTKSAVRAMDTISAFASTPEGGKHAVGHFTVAGGSKRGWTTWTTAATDERVVAICPIVIDLLNLEPNFTHHWEAYGFWAPAVGSYEEMGIMNWMGHPRYRDLQRLTEPYAYRDRYTMPKLVMNSAGDQFFLPDSSQFYWKNLPGPKWLRYVPNTGHGMGGSDASTSLTAFFGSVIHGLPMPSYEWKLRPDGSIRVTTNDEPVEVRLWQATNPNARDFRHDQKIEYTSTILEPQRKGVYIGRVPEPEKGWTAFFVELTFPTTVDSIHHKFTSQVHVVPDTLPFEGTLPRP